MLALVSHVRYLSPGSRTFYNRSFCSKFGHPFEYELFPLAGVSSVMILIELFEVPFLSYSKTLGQNIYLDANFLLSIIPSLFSRCVSVFQLVIL